MSINSPDSFPDEEQPEQPAANATASDGGIPGGQGGVGLGATQEPNTFEPEEAPDASADEEGEQ